MQVWIADDDQSIRWVLEQACDHEGIGTRCFADATSLLGALADDRPDVVVTDIRMPGVDGLDLLHRLHSFDRKRGSSFRLTPHYDAVSNYL